jgi:pyruvate/2-oxoacid:ferredoxin oxidoreductase beta subunit
MSVLTNPFRFSAPVPEWILVIHDDFTGTDGASLTSRSPNVVNNGSTWATTSASGQITSNEWVALSTNWSCSVTPGGSGGAAEATVTASTSAGTAAVAGTSTGGTEHAGVQLEVQSGTTNRYYRLVIIAGQGWGVYRNNGGTLSVLAIGGDGTTYGTGTVHTVRLERIGSAISAKIGGVEVWSGTDATSTGGDRAGIVSTTATGTKKFDDFKAYKWDTP